ncbi:MAG: TraB/GumN family protein [Planctomycetes bacterium]|nr:TraB/GumN family protein [Planctomycetota bacterium]
MSEPESAGSEPVAEVAAVQNLSMVRIEDEGREFFILGTAHVSARSVDDVREAIATLAPDEVLVELCPGRLQTLRDPEAWQKMDIFQVLKQGKGMLLISNLALSSFQRKIGLRFGVRPGAEMLAAVEDAEASGARLMLGDRPVQVTLKRAWASLSVVGRVKLFVMTVMSFFNSPEIDEKALEEMKEQDVLTGMMKDLGETFPDLFISLVDERDQYLSQKIRDCSGRKVLAVVGAGHIQGIQKYWHEQIDTAELDRLPKAGWLGKALRWIIPAVIVLALIYGFARGERGWEALQWWFGINAGLAGLGALLAWAHPLTILAAALAAPFTSLNPFVAAGWVSGLVEVFLRKPTVQDFQTLSDDAMTLRGFYRNRVTRVLLIAAFSNLGSAVGTYIGGFKVLQLMTH